MKKTVLFFAIMIYALIGFSQQTTFIVQVYDGVTYQPVNSAEIYYLVYPGPTSNGPSYTDTNGLASIQIDTLGVDSIVFSASAIGYNPEDISYWPPYYDTTYVYAYIYPDHVYSNLITFEYYIYSGVYRMPIANAQIINNFTTTNMYSYTDTVFSDSLGYATQTFSLDTAIVGYFSYSEIEVSAPGFITQNHYITPIGYDTIYDDFVLEPDSAASFISFGWMQEGADPYTVTFYPYSDLLGDTNIYTVEWTFGDGVTDYGTNYDPIVHTYLAEGSYLAEMYMNAGGIDYYFADSVYINNYYPDTLMCFADFYYYPLDETYTNYQFMNFSYGNITSFDWDFGDGNYSNEPDPVHAYTTSGQYWVSLSINTSDGCSSSIEYPIWVGIDDIWYPDTAQALFYTTYLGGTNVQFNDISYSDGPIAERYWDFGDGTFAFSVASPTHTYSDTGVYTIYYEIMTEFGAMSSYTQDIYVTGYPDTSLLFFPDTIGVGKSVAVGFNNATGNDGSDWVWNFGDSKAYFSGYRYEATHTYANPGQYHVTAVKPSGSGYGMDIDVNSDGTVDLLKGYAINKTYGTRIIENAIQQVQLYPNPVKDFLYVSVSENANYTIEIFDASGRVVFNSSFKGNRTTVNTSNLSEGFYTIKITNENEIYTGKFVK